jgi:hypothetical protein
MNSKTTLAEKRHNLCMPCCKNGLLYTVNMVKYDCDNHGSIHFQLTFCLSKAFLNLIAAIQFLFKTHSSRFRVAIAA